MFGIKFMEDFVTDLMVNDLCKEVAVEALAEVRAMERTRSQLLITEMLEAERTNSQQQRSDHLSPLIISSSVRSKECCSRANQKANTNHT